MRAHRLVRGITSSLLLGVALAACGSTVATTGAPPMDGGSELGALPDGGLGPDPSPLGGPATGGGEATPGAVVEALPRVTAGSGQPGGPSPAGEAARPGRSTSPLSGRGFTSKEIYLGFGTQDDVNQAAQAAGFSGVTFGDTKAQVRAVVDHANKQGGILGRKIVPVFVNASTANDKAVEAQAACTAWTQDRKVFAVLNPVGRQTHDNLYACLAKAGVPLLRYTGANTDHEDYRRFEHYAPGNITGKRFAPVWMARLKAQGYFSGWDTRMGGPAATPTKVGLVLLSTHDKLRPLVETELRRQGHAAVETFVANEGAGPQDFQSTVLRFAAQGVTHVVVPSAEILYFMIYAESQSYRPRYAISSWVAPGALLQLAAPQRQMVGSMGVGYVPSVDVDADNDPGDVSPSTTLCRKIMTDAGQDTSVRLTFLVMLAECDMVFLLQRALNQQGIMSNQAVRSGIELLGASFPSAITFKTLFTATQHDGATVVRDLAYGSECSCFRYSGPPTTVPQSS